MTVTPLAATLTGTGYNLEFNCLLRVPASVLDLNTLEVGKRYTITKDKSRLYPVNVPIEICDDEYRYFGKVLVRKLTLDGSATVLEVEVIKLFDEHERNVFSENFIPIKP